MGWGGGGCGLVCLFLHNFITTMFLTSVMCLYRIGAVLRILGVDKFIEDKSLRGFLLTCQSEVQCFSFTICSSKIQLIEIF